MQSKVKSNSVVTSRLDEATNEIVFGVVGAGETRLKLGAISQAIRTRAVIHGLTQRVADRAAKNRDATNGKAATPESKLAAMAALVDHYNSGSEEWGMAGAGSGPRLDQTIIAALAEVLAKPREEVLAFVAAGAGKHGVAQSAYLAKLGTGVKVQPVVDRLRAEGAGDVDADEELEGLMGD